MSVHIGKVEVVAVAEDNAALRMAFGDLLGIVGIPGCSVRSKRRLRRPLELMASTHIGSGFVIGAEVSHENR